MNRRSFLKVLALLGVNGLVYRSIIQNGSEENSNTARRFPKDSNSVTGAPWETGRLDFREIDDKKLGEWWAALNDFELPKEFGEVPKFPPVNETDYLRGAFRILNAICPKDTANEAWLRRVATRSSQQ